MNTIGFGLFVYGKREVRVPQLVVGLMLMGATYFTEGVGNTLGVAGVLIGGMVLALRSGN